ncbi:hypothetical protein ACP275_06G012000 [Erythranthe tilingii]
MEKEEQKWEEAEVEQHEEEEESSLVTRKSRNEDASKTTDISATEDVELSSDGVSNSNGHETPSEIAEFEELITSEIEGPKTEERDVAVLENEPEAIEKGELKTEDLENEQGTINGEHKPENLVSYDKVEGVDSTSANSGENITAKGPAPKEFDISSPVFIVQNNSTSVIINNYEVDPSQASVQERGTSYENSTKEIESAEDDLINGDDLEVADLDVEKVLQEQNTHDLYCPNCNSCITRRVILRKRKRRIRISDEEFKRTRITAQLPRDQVHYTDDIGDNDAQIPAVDEDERNRGPDIFRCLSCFSFFIPSGDGFKLFGIFGGKSRKENMQNEQAPRIKKNWFTFASNQQETTVEQAGSSIETNVQRGDAGIKSSTVSDQSGEQSFVQTDPSPAHVSERLSGTAGKKGPQQDGDKILPSPEQKTSINGKIVVGAGGGDKILPSPEQKTSINGKVVGAGDKFDIKATETVDAIMEQFDGYTGYQTESKTSEEIHVGHESDLSITTLPMRAQVTDGAISYPQHGGLKLLVPYNKESPTLEIPEEKPIIPHQTVHSEGHIYPSEVTQQTITKTKFEVHTGDSLIFDNISSLSGAPLSQGKDTVITIDAQTTGSSQTVQGTIYQTESSNVTEAAPQTSVAGGERTEARNETQIEVIKSIVYGGLAESVTSLSVVSSAAGGGADTLNILALGMASLIGGLFILFHNIVELRSDRIEQVSNQVSDQINDERDRYKELLGRRQNFLLHAVVAILSYLVFGLVAPVVYGFSFRETDDKQLKITVMAAVSLVCIVILAIGRAYVRRPPKAYVKSVTTFFIMGLMVSGVSYAAGVLVERLLLKLGLFQPSSVSNSLGPEIRLTGGGLGLASY